MLRPGSDVRRDPVYRLEAELFRTLGNPARIRLLELLADGERTVGELQEALDLESSSVSHHLTSLRRQGLLDSRKVGTSVFYRISDPRTPALLGIARELLIANLEDSHALLDELGAGTDRRVRAERGRL